ncbi:unnamed protein product [Brassicogethes aeneus]|uniref:Uncharacterized protein n=1 Tax=Brassicogethes aeneus TaxID=1431903 RepID=A0A9P0BBU5_BRAAE|nr:unnamed protein product [Brassicogethes aeneus]
MKTKLQILLIITFILQTKQSELRRKEKRGSFDEFPIGSYGSQSEWKGINTPIQKQNAGIDSYLPISGIKYGISQVPQVVSNSIDKPVQEAQEVIPPTSLGRAIIPENPPPATPVNAVAANIPMSQGALFLGSGSLGVVDLGNGVYALGSGSLGYSNRRSNPRPSIKSPLYPPIPASPNQIRAAVPSSIPPPLNPLPSYMPVSMSIDYNDPLLNYLPQPPPDENGYEYLAPNRVGFGSPLNYVPRIKPTMNFATPTPLQVPLEAIPHFPLSSYQFEVGSQDVSSQTIQFGEKLPNFYPQEIPYRSIK